MRRGYWSHIGWGTPCRKPICHLAGFCFSASSIRAGYFIAKAVFSWKMNHLKENGRQRVSHVPAPCFFCPAPLNRMTPLLWPDLHQAFLGHATVLVLLPLRMEPSFPNLFSAPKLNSEAASGSAFKTKLWLSQGRCTEVKHILVLKVTQPQLSLGFCLSTGIPPRILCSQHINAIDLGLLQGSGVTGFTV